MWGEKTNIVGEKAPADSKQRLRTCNWDPVDNEVEGWFGNEDCKIRNVSKTTFNLKCILQNKCSFNNACLFIV